MICNGRQSEWMDSVNNSTSQSRRLQWSDVSPSSDCWHETWADHVDETPPDNQQHTHHTAALQYVMYFRFYGWCHVFTQCALWHVMHIHKWREHDGLNYCFESNQILLNDKKRQLRIVGCAQMGWKLLSMISMLPFVVSYNNNNNNNNTRNGHLSVTTRVSWYQ